VQLVNADESVIWSDSYDRRLEDVFAVQEEIAQAVVRALEVKLVASRGPLVRPATKDLTAYDLFLKGRYVRRGMAPDQMRLAIDYFTRPSHIFVRRSRSNRRSRSRVPSSGTRTCRRECVRRRSPNSKRELESVRRVTGRIWPTAAPSAGAVKTRCRFLRTSCRPGIILHRSTWRSRTWGLPISRRRSGGRNERARCTTPG